MIPADLASAMGRWSTDAGLPAPTIAVGFCAIAPSHLALMSSTVPSCTISLAVQPIAAAANVVSANVAPSDGILPLTIFIIVPPGLGALDSGVNDAGSLVGDPS